MGIRQEQPLGHSPSLKGLELGTLQQPPLFKRELPTLGSTWALLGWCRKPPPQKTPTADSGRCVFRPELLEDCGALGSKGLLGGGGGQSLFATNQALPPLALTVTRSF